MDLTFPQAMVLTVLGEDGPVPISTLAERTGSATVPSPALWTGWRSWGWPKRQRSETDRRVIYVSATEKYAALRDKAVGRCEQLLLHPDGPHGGGGPGRWWLLPSQKLDEALSQVEEKGK